MCHIISMAQFALPNGFFGFICNNFCNSHWNASLGNCLLLSAQELFPRPHICGEWIIYGKKMHTRNLKIHYNCITFEAHTFGNTIFILSGLNPIAIILCPHTDQLLFSNTHTRLIWCLCGYYFRLPHVYGILWSWFELFSFSETRALTLVRVSQFEQWFWNRHTYIPSSVSGLELAHLQWSQN